MQLSLILFATVCGAAYAYNPDDLCYDMARQGSEVIQRKHCDYFMNMKNPESYFQCIERHGYPFYESAEKCQNTFWSDREDLSTTEGYLKRICSKKPEDFEEAVNLICCIVSREVAARNETGADKVDISRTCIAIQQLENNMKNPCSVN